jgi:hypothetical protein
VSARLIKRQRRRRHRPPTAAALTQRLAELVQIVDIMRAFTT